MSNIVVYKNHISQNTFTDMETDILMAEATGHKSEQETIKIHNDMNLKKNGVLDALTGVPYIENICRTMVCVRDG